MMSSGTESLAMLRAALSPAESACVDAIERVKARFLETDRDAWVARRFRWLLKNQLVRADPTRPIGPGNRREARCVVVVGNSGAGKTHLLRRVFSSHPNFTSYGVENSGCKLVTVDVPAPCTLLQLGRRTLAAIGYPIQGEMKEHRVWERVFYKLQETGILVLHFDEMHNILESANVDDIRRIRKTLKALLVNADWPVGLMVSGLPGITDFLETLSIHELDQQGNLIPREIRPVDRETELRRRCRVIGLASLDIKTDLEMIALAAADMAAAGDLILRDGFQETVAARLVHASLYELGTCMELTAEAMEMALDPDDEDEDEKDRLPRDIVGIEHFAAVYRERTGCGPGANPFLAPEWWILDCTKVLRTKNEPDPVPPMKTVGKSKTK